MFFASTIAGTVSMYDVRSPSTSSMLPLLIFFPSFFFHFVLFSANFLYVVHFGKANSLGKISVGAIVTSMDSIHHKLFTTGTDNCLNVYDIRNPGDSVQVS